MLAAATHWIVIVNFLRRLPFISENPVFPSFPPSNGHSSAHLLARDERIPTPTHTRLTSSIGPELPLSVTVGGITFNTGRVMNMLSETEAQVLELAFGSQTLKKQLGEVESRGNDRMLTYDIGADDYFASAAERMPVGLPEKMMVTCALDRNLILRRTIITDLNQLVYCDAKFDAPVTPAQAQGGWAGSPSSMVGRSSPGSTASPFASPSAPTEPKQLGRMGDPGEVSRVAMTSSSSIGAPAWLVNKKRATEGVIRANLTNQFGEFRSAREVLKLLRSAGYMVSNTTLSTVVKAGLNTTGQHSDDPNMEHLKILDKTDDPVFRTHGKSATDDQFVTYMRGPDNTLLSTKDCLKVLYDNGLGATSRRVYAKKLELLNNAGASGRAGSPSDADIYMQ